MHRLAEVRVRRPSALLSMLGEFTVSCTHHFTCTYIYIYILLYIMCIYIYTHISYYIYTHACILGVCLSTFLFMHSCVVQSVISVMHSVTSYLSVSSTASPHTSCTGKTDKDRATDADIDRVRPNLSLNKGNCCVPNPARACKRQVQAGESTPKRRQDQHRSNEQRGK